MESLLHHVRFAVRALVRRPVFTLIAVATLALGIGANTTVLSLTAEVFLHPLPVEEPQELLFVGSLSKGENRRSWLSFMNWMDLREQNESFAEVAAYEPVSINVAIGDGAVYLPGQMVSGNYFETLGIRAAHGRLFTSADNVNLGAHPVTVLSHRLWTTRLGGDPGIVGSTLRLNGHPFTVIGIAPSQFKGLEITSWPRLWVPLKMHPVIATDRGYSLYEGNRWASVVKAFGRLRPGVSAAQAMAEVRAIGDRLSVQYPDANGEETMIAGPLAEDRVPHYFRDQMEAAALLLLGMVVLVLLIVCANIANLLLSRAAERRGEIAIRLALGIGRGRLLSQLVAESLLLAFLGGGAGLLLAWISRQALAARLAGMPIPLRELEMAFDGRLLAFTFVLALAAGLLFSLFPAIQAWRFDLVSALGSGGRSTGSRRRLQPRHVLVVAQVAFCVVLLFLAGLFLRSLGVAEDVDPGFETERLAMIGLDLAVSGYSSEEGATFQRRLVEETEALPGVEAAVLAQAGPIDWGWLRAVSLPGEDDDESRMISSNVVGPGFFEVMGIEIERGRSFLDRARSRPSVAVVNRLFAEQLWGARDPLGERFRIRSSRTDYTVEVVGIARPAAYEHLIEEPRPYVYLPAALEYRPDMKLVVRTSADPGPQVEMLRRHLREMDPDMVVVSTTTVGEVIDGALWGPRASSVLLGVFGLIALVLAAIGIYGVLSLSVTSRQRELGIRIAIGALRSNILGMIFRHSFLLVAVGLAAGLALAAGASRLFVSILLVEPADLRTFFATVAVLSLVAVVATLVPALRAVRIHPAEVLRQE